nr:MAG TPA: hypothetical protein [Caudoviricetes sp.]
MGVSFCICKNYHFSRYDYFRFIRCFKTKTTKIALLL